MVRPHYLFTTLVLLSACAQEPSGPMVAEAGTIIADPSLDFPEQISELGLFPALPSLNTVPVEALVYEPTWPLWTNSLAKLRHIRVPDGETVDVTEPSVWRYPDNTLFFKTFMTTDPSHPGGQRPLETRVFRTIDGDVEFATYVWDPDGHDGHLTDMKLPIEVEVTEDGETFMHGIPNKLQCRKCHESHRTLVIGFASTQLSPAAADELTEAGIFAETPALNPVEHPEPETKEILGYLLGNCVHCHNGTDGPSSSYDLSASVALEALIGQPTEGSASAPGIRIVPGDPEASILYQALINNDVENEEEQEGGEEAKAMPPLGVQLKDAEMIEKIRLWILALDPN